MLDKGWVMFWEEGVPSGVAEPRQRFLDRYIHF